MFRRLDYRLWRRTAHNPVRMLHQISRERLEWAARDGYLLSLYDAAVEEWDRARATADGWWSSNHRDLAGTTIAYFSAEFALHQSLPIYAGGLGVLAGDHCKEASDLGIPLVGVGFMYPMGYFHQHISADGWQLELYERLDRDYAAVERARLPQGDPCVVNVTLGRVDVKVAAWLVKLGTVKLYLLDTDVDGNTPWDRELSGRLYASEHEIRLKQEIILGVGGVRVLRALGYQPVVWHLNEGHTAFVVFERIRELVGQGRSFPAAVDEVRATTVFTTHTPVPAGHDAFPFHLTHGLLNSYWDSVSDPHGTYIALGAYGNGAGDLFNMTALALRGSGAVNAVSLPHREVTDEMWAPLWSRMPRDSRRPIKAVTNGVHIPTWIAPPMAELFDKWLGSKWRELQDDRAFWELVFSIPDEDLWQVRCHLKSHMMSFIHERARRRWAEEQASAAEVVAAGTLLDDSVLTLGFARRFTEYKRPTLLFHDCARLAGILRNYQRPVQIIFAGKAHPSDELGKRLLQSVYRLAGDPRFGGRIAFVDDYDLHLAHYLVQGCDAWLNYPREPMEACGTSGMKASINGVVHISVPGGWWTEGFSGDNGWLVRPSHGANGDAAEAEALYRTLEHEVVPAFYDHDSEGIPRNWLRMVREAIRTVAPRFSARRMLRQYAEQMYAPMARAALARRAR